MYAGVKTSWHFGGITILLLLQIFLLHCIAQGQNAPYMVKDITTSATTSSNSWPAGFVQMGRDVFFSTRLVTGQSRLNRLNLDQMGVWPVQGSYYEVMRLFAYQGILYFAASTTTPNYTGGLWKVDGEGKAVLLKLMSSTVDGTRPPYSFTEGNGTLYFVGSGGGAGSELWKTDGTGQNTVLVKDIRPGTQSSIIRDMIWFAGKLYFWANNGTQGVELWTSDGTAAGTLMVKDINQGIGDGFHDYIPASIPMMIWGSHLVFAAKDQSNQNWLWMSDGTSSGTMPFHGPALPIAWSVYNDNLYFMTRELAEKDCVLWKSNGSTHGTVVIKEFAGGTSYFEYPLMSVGAGKIFFTVRDAPVGNEIWISDGTIPGTNLVADIMPDAQGSYPSLPVEWKGRLYFHADDGLYQRELWSCDSNGSNAQMVKDIRPDGAGMENQQIFPASDLLLFPATDGVHGMELWASDGTAAGTQMLQDLDPLPLSSSFSDLVGIKNNLFAAVSQKEAGIASYRLWKSNGVAAQTLPVTAKATIFDAALNSAGIYAGKLSQNVNDTLFFLGNNAAAGWELWKTDGTDPGTVLVKDITAGTGNTGIRASAASGSLFYFRKQNASADIGNDEIWRSDGTANGTFAVKAGNLDSASAWPGIGDGKGSLCFVAKDTVWGSELWLSNGTVAGTQRATSISSSSQHTIYPEAFFWNGAFHFVDEKEDGYRLRKLNPITRAMQIVGTLNLGLPTTVSIRSIDYFTPVGNQFFFRVSPSNASFDQQIWRTDGTLNGTKRIASATGFGFLAEYKGLLLFSDFLNQSGALVQRLWSSDGTASAPLLIKEMPDNALGLSPALRNPGDRSGVVGDTLYFTAMDNRAGVSGYHRALWKSDGTAQGTARYNIVPGAPLQDPQHFTKVGDSLFFEANDGIHGQELWRVAPLGITRVDSWINYQ